jgi:hypothetical protein
MELFRSLVQDPELGMKIEDRTITYLRDYLTGNVINEETEASFIFWDTYFAHLGQIVTLIPPGPYL